MKTAPEPPRVWDMDDGTGRFALTIGGIARYVGSREECERRYAIATATSDPLARDRALARALDAAA